MLSVAACDNTGNDNRRDNRNRDEVNETKATISTDVDVPDQSIAEVTDITDVSEVSEDETVKPVKIIKKYTNDELRLTTEYDLEGHEIKVTYHYDREIDFIGTISSGNWDSSEYDDKGNLIKLSRYDCDGNILDWEEYEYDSSCNMIKKTYFRDGKKGSVYEYDYDDSGNITTEKISNDDTLKYWNDYEWDSYGNLTKGIVRYPDGTILMTNTYDNEYDNDGNLVCCTTYAFNEYYPDGQIAERKEFEYNTSGLCTKKLGYDGLGNLAYHEEWEYNEKGEEIKDIKYTFFGDPSGRIEEIWEYEYDINGNRIKRILTEYAADGSVSDTSTVNYRYEYIYYD